MLNKVIECLNANIDRTSLFVKTGLQTIYKLVTALITDIRHCFLSYRTPTFRIYIQTYLKNLIIELAEIVFGVVITVILYISILSLYYWSISGGLSVNVFLWLYPQYLIKVLTVWFYKAMYALTNAVQTTWTYFINPAIIYTVKSVISVSLLTVHSVKYFLALMWIVLKYFSLHTVLLNSERGYLELGTIILNWMEFSERVALFRQFEECTRPILYNFFYVHAISNAHFVTFSGNLPTLSHILTDYIAYIASSQLIFEELTLIKCGCSKLGSGTVEFNVNLVYNTLLWVYLVVIVIYSVYRNINYASITTVVNSILLALMLASLIKLVASECIWATSSDFKINNALLSVNVTSFYYDSLTFTFLFTIYTIGFIVHKYQFSYLNDSPSKEMFLITFNTFILSMVGVVSTSNWLLLLLSWEVLGLSSFFLIGYYKNKPAALKSALKAFIFNKLSDLFLIIAFAIYYFTYNTFYIIQQPVLTPNTEWIGTFLLLTAFVKSAQFCFYFWLPDSMEAPIPASALIHSATLVSAGIYLALRFIDIIEISTVAQYLILTISTLTMVFASLIAYNQTDIKKLLAYSTIANCGFIYFLIFLKAYKVAMIYFVVHGVIKSFSFIIAGDLIIQNNHIQDIRKWTNFNFHSKLKLLLLIIVMFLLAGTPISLVYTIKSGLFYSNYTSTYLYWCGSASLLMYTLNSYLYGLKLVFFILNKKIYYRKYRKYVTSTDAQNTTNSLLFILYFYLIIGIILCSSISIVTIAPTVSWKWLISIIVLSLGFVYSTIVNELVFLQVLLSVVLILNFII